MALDFPGFEGQGVFAVAQGTVIDTGYNPEGFGNYVIVEHDIYGFPVYSVYAHLSEVLVSDDEFLEDQYRLIGTVGNTGGQASSHLHYEVRLPANITLGPPDDDDPFRNHSYWALEHEGFLWTEHFLDLGSVTGYYGDFSWAIED